MRAPVLAIIALLGALLPLPAAGALPTPGFFCDLSDATTGRLFPEAMETNDFVSYDEAQCGLQTLVAQSPEWIKIDVVGQSVGWDSIAGPRHTFDVFVVKVSDYESAVPDEQKIRLVFQLSIHGNEKGGREGGLRLIEDLVRDIGYSKDHPEMRDRLSYMELLFVFPNPDGWTHEELEYRHNDACYFSLTCNPGDPGLETQGFVRVNGNGVDVNRELPTSGWQRERHTALSEPEAISLVDYLLAVPNVRYASDIHGMLNPADGIGLGCLFGALQVHEDPFGFDPTCFAAAVEGAEGHFVLTMLPAGRQSPREMAANTALAELVKERLNNDPYFVDWHALPTSTGGLWGGEFNDWGTVWDTIGYTDSGFTSDWYAQDGGLNALGIDFELSYNHVTFDNYYPGVAQRMNAYHVEITREIVRAFMDHAALTFASTIDPQGTRTAWLTNPTVVTNEGAMTVDGWAAENPADDRFDLANRLVRAAPDDYFHDLRAHLVEADGSAGVLDPLAPADLATRLGDYDNLVVAGSAWKTIAQDEAAKAAVRAWVEAGGNLMLTDEALQMLPDLGAVAQGGVEVIAGYAGATNFVDRDHALVADVRGLARQTFEPVPLGFSVSEASAPNWYVKADAFEGEVVGVAGHGQGSEPDPSMVNLGRATLGAGMVTFLGALLPDPTLDMYAPYGVDSYATTYTGNTILRNALGWTQVIEQAEVPVEELLAPQAAVLPAGAADAEGARVPSPGVGLLALAALGVALALRRRG